MRFNNLTNNFSSGEWSPKASARVDAQQYFSACETLKNFIPQIAGGAFFRPGTRRIFLDAALETDLQNAFSASVPFAVSSKVIPYLGSSGTSYALFCFSTQPSTTWFYLPTQGDAIDSGGVAISSVTSAANVNVAAASIKYTQVGDFLILVDGAGDLKPRVFYPSVLDVIDNGHITDQPWETVPYRDIQANGTHTITPSAVSGSVTLTSSTAFFNSGHVGAYFKFSSAGTTGVARVTAFTNSTTVTALVLSNVAATAHGTAAGTSWEESAWSDYRGWPRTVVAHQGRLIYGGNEAQPDTLWGSRAGNIFAMMERPFEQDDIFEGYTDDVSRPFTLTPNAKEASVIRALSADKTLLIHTDRNEIVGYGTQGILGPNDFTFESSSSFGANSPEPVRVNGFALFVQSGGRKVRDMTFNFDQDQYKSTDLSFLADHLTLDPNYFVDDITGGFAGGFKDPIVEIVGCNGQTPMMYAKTQNGRLLALVVDRDYQVNAWAQVELGGNGFQRDYPLVKSICAVSGDVSGSERLLLVVQRQINGASVVFLEQMYLPNEFETLNCGVSGAFDECAYLDSYVAGVLDPDLVTWIGFEDYVGETLAVFAEGQYIGNHVVNADGEIVLTEEYDSLGAGYLYEGILKPLPIEIGQQVPGSPKGTIIKRVEELGIDFYLSRGCQYGHDENNMYTIDFKDPNAAGGDLPALFTGLKTVRMPTDYSKKCQIIIKQTKPFPCNVLSIAAKGMTYG